MLLAGAASGTLYALDTATGNERWRARIDGSFLGSPNLLAGTPGAVLAIDQGEAILHAFHPETGALLWKTESIDRCDGSPSAGSDFSAYGSCAAALHVVDTTAGKLVRSIEIEGDSQVAGGVAIDGDLLVSGCRSGKVLQVNARSGQVLWTTTLGDAEIFATPAINAQWVVAAMEDGTVSGLERATGAVKWTMKSKPQPASPILAGERVLLSARGTLYLLNLADGAVLWSSEIADEISSPAMAMGLVLIGGKDGALTALRP